MNVQRENYQKGEERGGGNPLSLLHIDQDCVHARTLEHLFTEIIPSNLVRIVIEDLCTGCMWLPWAAALYLMQFQFFPFHQLLDVL